MNLNHQKIRLMKRRIKLKKLIDYRKEDII